MPPNLEKIQSTGTLMTEEQLIYLCLAMNDFNYGRITCWVGSPGIIISGHHVPSGGLNELVGQIATLCGEQGVPMVFAMSRRRLAYVLKKKHNIGCVGIFSYDGAEVRGRKRRGGREGERWMNYLYTHTCLGPLQEADAVGGGSFRRVRLTDVGLAAALQPPRAGLRSDT